MSESRIVTAESAEALYDLLFSLNDSGHYPEVAGVTHGQPFIAGLHDADYAGQTHYVHTDPDSGDQHCCLCSEHYPAACDHASWAPSFPAQIILTEDPDPSDGLDGPVGAWWRGCPMTSPIEAVAVRVLAEHGPDLAIGQNRCWCGAVIHDDSQFRAHVAAEFARAVAEDAQGVRVPRSVEDATVAALIDEYGEDDATWREMRSARRVAAAVIRALTTDREETDS